MPIGTVSGGTSIAAASFSITSPVSGQFESLDSFQHLAFPHGQLQSMIPDLEGMERNAPQGVQQPEGPSTATQPIADQTRSCPCVEQGQSISLSLSKHQHSINTMTSQSNVDISADILGQTKKAVNSARMLLNCTCESNEKAVPLAIALVAQVLDIYGTLSRSLSSSSPETPKAFEFRGEDVTGQGLVLSWLRSMSDTYHPKSSSAFGNGCVLPCVRVDDFVLDDEEAGFMLKRLLRFRLEKLQEVLRMLELDVDISCL
jgi:hypothetical protein